VRSKRSAIDLRSAFHREKITLDGLSLFSEVSGEPPRNRTENPQIKSLLLYQLS
jgi:hypothetical protein